MKLTPTPLAGAFVVDIDVHEDERGFFARTFDPGEFAALGLDTRVAQCSISFNRRAGTLRGMHWQAEPHGEVKLVRCTAGAIHDVIVDLRPSSPTRFAWCAVELSARNHRALYIPVGFAHGLQALADDTEVSYQISTPFHGPAARGLRFDDPRLGIAWPLATPIVNARDRAWPLLGSDA